MNNKKHKTMYRKGYKVEGGGNGVGRVAQGVGDRNYMAGWRVKGVYAS